MAMYPTVIQAHDDELRQHVIDSLVARGVAGWEKLDVTVASGVLVITGRLSTPIDKTICLECCRHVAGVMRVVDQVTVRRSRVSRQPTPRSDPDTWYF